MVRTRKHTLIIFSDKKLDLKEASEKKGEVIFKPLPFSRKSFFKSSFFISENYPGMVACSYHSAGS